MTKPDHAVWVDVLSFLRTRHPDMCRQWFEEIHPIGVAGGVFRVRVDQSIRQRYLQRECAQRFNDALQAVTGALLAVRFVGPADDTSAGALAPHHNGSGVPAHHHNMHAPPEPTLESASGLLANGDAPLPQVHTRLAPGLRHDALIISPDHTFENFVVGPETRLAFAAAKAVCENPGRAYNPLFIHGGVGLGKTHLLQAICLRLLALRPELVIYYVSCEEFMTQFMDAVQAGQMNDFRHRFRDVDVLVIDDIHFLAKRDRTQEEFFHTFNALYQAQKQIVLSSDAPPNEIPDLEARLVSRFQCGLVVQVSSPCYETRVQIVKQKAKIRGLDIPDEAACYIAAKAPTNIRELEGAIVRVQMVHVTDGKPITLELAKAALDPGGASLKPEVTITGIIDAVVAYYGVKLTDLQSKRRQKSIAHPRQVCMYLARRHTRYSLEEIGGYFGGRDHTTVMHAVKTIEERRDRDDQFGKVLFALEEKVRVPLALPAATT